MLVQFCTFVEDDIPKGGEPVVAIPLVFLAHFPPNVQLIFFHLILALQFLPPASSLDICVPAHSTMFFFGCELLKSSDDSPSSRPHLDVGASFNVFLFLNVLHFSSADSMKSVCS